MQEKTHLSLFDLTCFYFIISHSIHLLARNVISFFVVEEIPLVCIYHIFLFLVWQ